MKNLAVNRTLVKTARMKMTNNYKNNLNFFQFKMGVVHFKMGIVQFKMEKLF